MNLSHLISDAVLALTALGVLWYCFGQTPLYNRMLWGFFLMAITLAALTGVAVFSGYTPLEPLHDSLQRLAGSFGIVCLVTAVYALVMRQTLGLPAFGISLAIGLALFVVLLLPRIRPFEIVVAPLGMLLIMLMAVFALLRRNKQAIWLVIAVMLAGLATKGGALNLPLSPIDLYHYSLAGALICFGRANRSA